MPEAARDAPSHRSSASTAAFTALAVNEFANSRIGLAAVLREFGMGGSEGGAEACPGAKMTLP